jgi:hypothetical protein
MLMKIMVAKQAINKLKEEIKKFKENDNKPIAPNPIMKFKEVEHK